MLLQELYSRLDSLEWELDTSSPDDCETFEEWQERLLGIRRQIRWVEWGIDAAIDLQNES